jgi:hypothetical protein
LLLGPCCHVPGCPLLRSVDLRGLSHHRVRCETPMLPPMPARCSHGLCPDSLHSPPCHRLPKETPADVSRGSRRCGVRRRPKAASFPLRSRCCPKAAASPPSIARSQGGDSLAFDLDPDTAVKPRRVGCRQDSPLSARGLLRCHLARCAAARKLLPIKTVGTSPPPEGVGEAGRLLGSEESNSGHRHHVVPKDFAGRTESKPPKGTSIPLPLLGR